jgi:hypothetical protein
MKFVSEIRQAQVRKPEPATEQPTEQPIKETLSSQPKQVEPLTKEKKA